MDLKQLVFFFKRRAREYLCLNVSLTADLSKDSMGWALELSNAKCDVKQLKSMQLLLITRQQGSNGDDWKLLNAINCNSTLIPQCSNPNQAHALMRRIGKSKIQRK